MPYLSRKTQGDMDAQLRAAGWVHKLEGYIDPKTGDKRLSLGAAWARKLKYDGVVYNKNHGKKKKEGTHA